MRPPNEPKIRDKDIAVLGDSGSSWSLISNLFKNYASEIKPLPPRLSLVGANGGKIPLSGIGIFNIQIGNLIIKTEFVKISKGIFYSETTQR